MPGGGSVDGGSSGTIWWHQRDHVVAARPYGGSSGTIWWHQRDHVVAAGPYGGISGTL
jgi:hypothetical protein